MMEWKWTYGGRYEKSSRLQKQQQQQQQQPNQNSETVQHNIAQMAQHQSLLSENDIWSLDDPMNNMEMSLDKPLNKREDTYNKMSEREMIGQIGMSPFSNSNYINDVMVQENFLKPVSTSSGRENQSSE
jgi:hypothetical protein